MIRILINSRTDALAEEYATRLKNEYDVIAKLEELKNHMASKRKFKRHVEYLSDIIDNYDNIIRAKPSNFDNIVSVLLSDQEFCQKTPPIPKSKGKATKKQRPVPFYMLVVHAMGYEWARNHLLPTFMIRLGIKSCVYCNAQYGITLKKEDNTYTSSYEFDHFKPKSVFPHLSTTFYNLQPSCGHCNRLKWKNDAKFNLYTESFISSRPFKFSLSKKSILEFMLFQDDEKLDIRINASENGLLDSQENLFKISKKYESHRDEAAELIILSKIYNSSFLKQLNNSILDRHPQYYDRYMDVILGFPIDERQVHKRPLTLMKQDIAKQLGLL